MRTYLQKGVAILGMAALAAAGVFLLLPKPEPLPLYGMTTGSFSVSPDGTAAYQISIAVPPGTHALGPQLSVAYSSGGGGGGVMGNGFALSGFSSISRAGATPAQDGFRGGVNYDANDRFTLDGLRLMNVNTVNGGYGGEGAIYRTEIDKQSKIVASGECGSGPCSFLVTQKNGVQMAYGTSTDSRVLAQGAAFQTGNKAGSVQLWLLNKITDNFGNSMVFSYSSQPKDLAGNYVAGTQSGGVSYPVQIAYTIHGNGAAMRKVHFYYESRPDSLVQCAGGAVTQAFARLSAIKSYVLQANGDSILGQTYVFAYDSEAPLNYSRLKSVVEGANGQFLPPNTFAWTDGANTFKPQNNIAWGGPTDNQGFTGDFNGDGKTDIFAKSNTTVYLATANGFVAGANTHLSLYSFVYVADFNGDAISDILTTNGNSGYIYYAQNGTFSASNYKYFSGLHIPATGAAYVWTGDFNGDALTDLLYSVQGATYLNLGNINTGLVVADTSLNLNLGGGLSFAADFNGDGMTDIFNAQNQAGSLYISNFSQGTTFAQPIPCPNMNVNTTANANNNWVADYNGDGLPDLLACGTDGAYRVYTANGAGFQAGMGVGNLNLTGATIWPADFNGDGFSDFFVPTGSTGLLYRSNGLTFSDTAQFSLSLNTSNTYLGDFNGDGITDIFNAQTSQMAWGGNKQQQIPVPNLLTSIENGVKGKTLINYKPISDSSVYTKGSSTPLSSVENLSFCSNFASAPLSPMQVSPCPVLAVQNALYVVASYATTDGRGAWYKYGLRYSGAKTDLNGYGFLGFGTQTVSDSAQQKYTKTTFNQLFPLTGTTDSTITANFGMQLLQQSAQSYENAARSFPANQTVYRVNQTAERTSFYAQGQFAYATLMQYRYDDWGNLIRQTNYGNLAAPNTTYTLNTYQNDTANWLIGNLIASTVAADSLGKNSLTQQTFSYKAGTSAIVSTQTWDDQENKWQRLTVGYDEFGNAIFSVSPANDTTYTVFDSTYHSFPAAVYSPPNQQKQRLRTATHFDPVYGNPIWEQDANNNTTFFQYDAIGRKILTQIPDNAGGSFTFSGTCYLPSDSVGYVQCNFLAHSWTTGKYDSVYQYLDALGRNYLSKSYGWQGQPIWEQQDFNSENKPTGRSTPYFVGESPRKTRIVYNANEKPIRLVQPLGDTDSSVTKISYQGMLLRVCTAAGTPDSAVSLYTYGIFASQKKITAFQNPDGGVTNYQYDLLGRSVKVTDPGNLVTALAWNSLSETIWVYTPSTDTTFYLTLDSLRLNRIITAKRDTIWNVADALGRKIVQKYGKTDSIIFRYDLAGNSNSQGLLSQTLIPHYQYSVEQSYDANGNIAQTVSSMGGNAFTEKLSYYPDGTPQQLIFPDNSQLNYQFSPQGLLSAISYQAANYNQGNSLNVLQYQQYNAWDKPLAYRYGNQVSTQFSYDASGYLTKRKLSGPAQQPLLNLGWQYNHQSNMEAVLDSLVPTQSRQYRYKASGRIQGVSGNSYQDSCAYDASGNLLLSNNITRQYDNYQVNTLTSATNAPLFSLKYDANGNITDKIYTDSSYHYCYNALNQLDSVMKNGQPLYAFAYDASGNRIRKTDITHQATTYYVEGNYLITQSAKGNGLVKNIQYDNQLFANLTDNHIQYFHGNQVQSIEVITDSLGNTIQSLQYDTYGNVRAAQSSLPVRYRFNGQEWDESSRMLYFNARYYDAEIGRFLSADDQLGGSLLETDAFNRYAFCLNNPINAADLSGHVGAKAVAIVGTEVVADLLSEGSLTGEEVIVDADLLASSSAEDAVGEMTDEEDAKLTNGGNDMDENDIVQTQPSVTNPVTPTTTRRSTRVRTATQKFEVKHTTRERVIKKSTVKIQKRIPRKRIEKYFAEMVENIRTGKQRPFYESVNRYATTGSKREFSPAQKKAIYEANKKRNGGKLICDITGQELVAPKQCKSGVSPNIFEAQIDHFYPFVDDGTNDYSNALIVSRYVNGMKSSYRVPGIWRIIRVICPSK